MVLVRIKRFDNALWKIKQKAIIKANKLIWLQQISSQEIIAISKTASNTNNKKRLPFVSTNTKSQNTKRSLPLAIKIKTNPTFQLHLLTKNYNKATNQFIRLNLNIYKESQNNIMPQPNLLSQLPEEFDQILDQEICGQSREKGREDDVIDEMYEWEFEVEGEVGDGENWKIKREQDNRGQEIYGKGEQSEKGDQGTVEKEEGKQQQNDTEKLQVDKLQSQIKQMQEQVRQMFQMITLKHKLLQEQYQSQNIDQTDKNTIPHLQSALKTPSHLTLLESQHANNTKTQQIYLKQLSNLQKQLTHLQTQSKFYLQKMSENSSAAKSNQKSRQPLELSQLIEREILHVKESLVKVEKESFGIRQQIKNNARKQQKTDSGSYIHGNNITHTATNYQQLLQSITLKKKLHQKLQTKLSKLQFTYNASFIKTQQLNDTLTAMLSQFPQPEQDPAEPLTKRLTMSRFVSKHNEHVINRNLYEIIRKRKEKVLRGNELLRRQFQLKEKELERDVAGLAKLVEEKNQAIEGVSLKNSQVQSQTKRDQGKIGKNLSVSKERNLSQSKMTNDLPSSLNETQQPLQHPAQEPQSFADLKFPPNQNFPSVSPIINLKVEISLPRRPQITQHQNLSNLTDQQPTENKVQPTVDGLVCCQEMKENQESNNKVEIQENMESSNCSIGNANEEKQQEVYQQQQMISNKEKIYQQPLTQSNSFNLYLNSNQQPIPQQPQENANFRITRPKFPKHYTKDKSRVIISGNNLEKSQLSSNIQDHHPFQSFSSPKLLKPALSTPKNQSIALNKSFRNNNRKLSKSIQLSQINIQTERQHYQFSPIMPRSNSISTKPLFSQRKPVRYNNSSDQRPIFGSLGSFVTMNEANHDKNNNSIKRQSETSLKHMKKEKQMMNVLRQSIMKVTKQGKRQKINNQRQTERKRKQINGSDDPDGVDNHKTLRNLINQNLSMIKNQSFTERDMKKQGSKQMFKEGNVFNAMPQRPHAIQTQEQYQVPTLLDNIKTPKKTKHRPYLHSSKKSPSKASPVVNPDNEPPNPSPSIIQQQMQQVKFQIQSTILKIKSIQEKIQKESKYRETSGGIVTGRRWNKLGEGKSKEVFGFRQQDREDQIG